MMVWHIGNTTVRTPYRLIGALAALPTSKFNGSLSGRDRETEFALFLDQLGLVTTDSAGANVSSLGRKWRSALSQLGFITPALTRSFPSGQVDPLLKPMTDLVPSLTGRQYETTPSGRRLAASTNFLEQQDCFLRALAAYQIPSRLERGTGSPFSPLRHVIRLLLSLEAGGAAARFSFEEFALIVQTSTADEPIPDVAARILAFRAERAVAAGNVRAFYRTAYDRASALYDLVVATFDDYADLSMRYLKATGVFQSAGRGIQLSPGRRFVAELLAAEPDASLSDTDYLVRLWRGAELPTDNVHASVAVIEDLRTRLRDRGVMKSAPVTGADQQQLESYRFELEIELRHLDEEEYAAAQVGKIEEIACWLQALSTGTPVTGPSGERISVPKGEAPAYLEWALWRAFLAIDSLINKPWEARRFQIDQDFLPVGCAPGGGPDAFFVYDREVIVLEATLSDSSRQEAMEGEPVRRHVADFEQRFGPGKKVYGLFVAKNINSNTAHTFRMGEWYRPDDTPMYLDIVPLRIDQLLSLLRAGLADPARVRPHLLTLLRGAREVATRPAPQWKQQIAALVERVSAEAAVTAP